jgi:hypothetical protein
VNDLGKPQRVEPTSVAENRLVRAAMAEVAAGMEELQREAAFLRTIAGRPGTKPDRLPLQKAVAATRARLEKAVAKLPDHLRTHGRVTDLRKAIASLEVQLQAIDN